jgi:hypothetical protein
VERKGQAPPAAAPRPFKLTIEGTPPAGLANEWRGILDRALDGGQGVLDHGAPQPQRSFIERDMKFVRQARAGDIVMAMLAPEVMTACMNLERYASAPAMETSTRRDIAKSAFAERRRKGAPAIEARLKWIEDACCGHRSIDDQGIVGWLVDQKGAPETAKELARLTKEIYRDVRRLRGRKKPKDMVPLRP